MIKPVAHLLAAVLTLGLAGTARAAPAKPMRIMSMNMCTDLLVLQLAPKARIVSVSYLAAGAAWAVKPGLDKGVGTNRGTAEDVAGQRPDLILAGDFSTPTVRRLAKQIGAPLIEVKSAESFEDIRVVIRQVAAAVGETERGETLIREMDANLADLHATRPRRPIVVAAWSGDSVAGKHTLSNAIIEAAGAVNVAAVLPDNRYSTFGLEQLLAAGPSALLYGGGRSRAPSMRLDLTQHPVLMARYRDRRLSYPDPLYSCGLPQSAEAARELRNALAALPPIKAFK